MRIIPTIVATFGILYGATAFAATTAPPPPRLEARDEVLAAFVSFLEDAPPVYLKATFDRPETWYLGLIEEKWLTAVKPLNDRLKTVGLAGSYLLGGIDWEWKVNCGTVRTGFDAMDTGSDVLVWKHPEGEPPEGCPHADGPDHPGTITMRGRFSVGAQEDPTGDRKNLGADVYRAEWSIECVYEKGSSPGTAPCKVTRIETKKEAAPAAPTGNAERPAKPAPGRAAAAATAGGALAIGGAYLYWRRFRSRPRGKR